MNNGGWLLAAVLVALAFAGIYMGRATVAAAALHLLEKLEGREARAYKDSAGYWTIGVGHKVLPSEMARYVGQVVTVAGKLRGSVVLTAAEIDALLAKDTATAGAAVARLVKVKLSEAQRAALVSFTFNLGEGRLAGSTLLRLLNAGDYAGAARQFDVWNKETINGVLQPNRGLTARRLAERTLFESGAVA